MGEGILRSANCTVKAAAAPHKEVILVISYGGHKSVGNFERFDNYKTDVPSKLGR